MTELADELIMLANHIEENDDGPDPLAVMLIRAVAEIRRLSKENAVLTAEVCHLQQLLEIAEQLRADERATYGMWIKK